MVILSLRKVNEASVYVDHSWTHNLLWIESYMVGSGKTSLLMIPHAVYCTYSLTVSYMIHMMYMISF